MVHDGKRRVDGFKVRVVSHHLNDKGYDGEYSYNLERQTLNVQRRSRTRKNVL